MAKRNATQLDAIIREKMPGYHLAHSAQSGAAGDSDAPTVRRRQRRAAAPSSTPSIGDLRAKYLGDSDSAFFNPDFLAEEGEEAEIVTVEPDNSDDEPRHAKAVVISPDGEILGAQG